MHANFDFYAVSSLYVDVLKKRLFKDKYTKSSLFPAFFFLVAKDFALLGKSTASHIKNGCLTGSFHSQFQTPKLWISLLQSLDRF